MIKETELVVRIGLVVFAIADIFTETDCGEEATEPGGIAFFGGFNFFFGRSLDTLDCIGGGIHHHDISDLDFAILAGRDD